MNVMCTHCGTLHTIPAPVPPGVKYRCARCYAALPVGAEPTDPDPELRGLEPRLLDIERRLSTLEQRDLAAAAEAANGRAEAPGQPADIAPIQPKEPLVEREIMAEEKAKPPAADTFPWTYPPVPDKASVTQAEARQQEPPLRTIERPLPPPRRSVPSGSTTALKDWEQALPGNWLSRIGAVALFIGLGFLAKMAYDREWLCPVLQLILGLLLGGALLWAGHHWSQRYRVWAQALTGAGVAVLYLSLFASYALNDLMGFFPTYTLMFLVTAGAAVLALRQESMAIAIIGIIGAFLVPVILSTSDSAGSGVESGRSNPGLLIAYILILDAGIVWLATFRNWRWFVLLGLAGSLAVYGMWYATSGDEGSRLVAHGAMTGIFVFFVAATTLFHLLWRRVPQPSDLALMSLNAVVYFGMSFLLLWDDYVGWLGLISFLLAGLYGVLAYVAYRVSPENRRLSIFALGIALLFLTVAIPVQLQREWITVAWAAEGAILIWIASREGIRQLQVWGLCIFVLVFIRLFAFESSFDQEGFRPILNRMFLPFAVSIIAFYAAAYHLRKDQNMLHPWLFPIIALAANFLTLWLFSSEIVNFAGSRIIAGVADGAGFPQIRGLENARNVGLVSLWCVYGFGLVTVGLQRGWSWLRVPGYGLLLIGACATLATLNYSHALVESGASTPVLNYSFAAFAVCTAAFYLCAYMMWNGQRRLYADERLLFPALMLGASFLTLWALSSEIVTFVGDPAVGNSARNFALVSLWGAYGLGLVVVGLKRGWSWLRVPGYCLLLVGAGATLVVLNYGHALAVSTPSTPVFNLSFAAFAVCTAAFYLCSYLMWNDQRRLYADERLLFPALMLGASFLTLWALSLEIFTFVGDPEAGSRTRDLALILLWSAYGLGIVIVGVSKGWSWLRGAGYLLILIAGAITLFSLNYSAAMIQRETSTPILNSSFGAFAAMTAALYLSAYVLARNSSKVGRDEMMLFPALLVSANFLTLWALSSEILTFVSSGHGRNMGLTMLWAAYGTGLIGAGIAGRWRWVRVGGLGLVSMAMVKLFLFDTFTLESGYRVAAYLSLGVLLLIGGFVYHKYADKIKEFMFEEPPGGSDSSRDQDHS